MVVWIQNPFDNLPFEGYRKLRFWLMSEAFAAAGHDVVFWTGDFSHINKRPRPQPPADATPDFRLILLKTPPYAKNVSWARVRSHRAYAREWTAQAETAVAAGDLARPDVIIASLPTLSGAAAAIDLGKRFGARTVIDVMDAWPETFERLAPKVLRPLLRLALSPLRRQARRIYREADLVTGVCERYRELTERSDYHLAYHGIGDLASAPTPQPQPYGNRKVRLVYAGNLGRTYDLDTVLKAVEENHDFTLDIAGRWERDVPDRVRAHGYLERGDLQKLLSCCDIGIIPMQADSWVGIPYKLCDYAQAGLRIVSSLGGESSAILKRYRCGVDYRTGDVASLTAAIRQAIRLEAGASREMCEREFDARTIYADYVRRIAALSARA